MVNCYGGCEGVGGDLGHVRGHLRAGRPRGQLGEGLIKEREVRVEHARRLALRDPCVKSGNPAGKKKIDSKKNRQKSKDCKRPRNVGEERKVKVKVYD